MITAKEARKRLLQNPTFERKVELYKSVSEKIEKAVEEGKNYFSVTEEEHCALDKEILKAGFVQNPLDCLYIAMGGTHSYNIPA